MKSLIICIVGPSGSGKTTASMILQKLFGWCVVVSYTTRPMRFGEIDGKDHYFVKAKQKPPRSQMCAYTKFGGYEYWTCWEQFHILFPSIYVIDEKGLIELRNKEQAPFLFDLVTIKINRTKLNNIEQGRKDRDKERIQIPDKFYDYLIDNDGTIEDLTTQLYKIGKQIIQRINEYDEQ